MRTVAWYELSCLMLIKINLVALEFKLTMNGGGEPNFTITCILMRAVQDS